MLHKDNRLRKERDIKQVWKYGVSYYSPWLTLRRLKNKYKESRFGVVVSNKIAKKSTARNRMKRRLREVVRLNLSQIKPGFDCLLIARTPLANQPYKAIEKEVGNLFKKAGLLL